MTNTYYYNIKCYDIMGYAFHADTYCKDCGDSLPDTDPEGNDKHPIFFGDESPEMVCATCGETF